ncbi:transglycosylase family protein [Glutamicibacter sp.]|uniref:transglycosylase family protein n=1 Tax=Glutamicibacter sp. TaxID=1931995 RepID=UPI0028BE1DA8|nr:transglycosylase family protein [Glutamicibacter sp.]
MIQQKTKKIIRRGGATLAAFAVAGGAVVATTAPASAASTWDKLAQCESGGNWSINTGNGFSGGLQFTPSTWKAYGGKGSAHNASKAEQIRVATKVQQGQGWGAWPACTAKLGISGSPKGTSTADTAKKATSYAKKSTTTTKKAAKSYSNDYVRTSTRSAVPTKSVKSVAPATSGKRVAQAPAKVSYNVDVTDSGKNYTVKSGDTLFKIAQKLGVQDWRGLFELNSDQLTNPDMIMVGQTLNVPTK